MRSTTHITILVLVAITLAALCLIRIDEVCRVQADTLLELQTHRERVEIMAEEPVVEEPELISLGEFTLVHYCACASCCGKSDGITATGTVATAGRTIAVDPTVIPLGSTVIIDGHEYVAEDTGGGIEGKKIDIFCDSHQEAINRGVIKREVSVSERGI